MSIDAIRELRQRTGAPIAAVKSALEEESGDIGAAIDHLRKLGASLAAKKSSREAADGLVGIALSQDGLEAAIVELSSETDFVARTPQFGELLRSLTQSALLGAKQTALEKGTESISVPELLAVGDNAAGIQGAVASLGENIQLRRAAFMRLPKGLGGVFGYVHGSTGESTGRIGVLVALEGTVAVQSAGKRAAMHIAAAFPEFLSKRSIPANVVEKEREILLEAARADQKPGSKPRPDDILRRIADGRMEKWYSQVSLEDQEMLVEVNGFSGKPRPVVDSLRDECADAKLIAFCRFAIGGK